jgi:hypothetical protein
MGMRRTPNDQLPTPKELTELAKVIAWQLAVGSWQLAVENVSSNV